MVHATRRPAALGSSSPARADVRILNPEERRVALITDWGYTVASILSGELRLHDVVEGAFETAGRAHWTNLSTGQPVSVTVTHVQATMLGAERLVRR